MAGPPLTVDALVLAAVDLARERGVPITQVAVAQAAGRVFIFDRPREEPGSRVVEVVDLDRMAEVNVGALRATALHALLAELGGEQP